MKDNKLTITINKPIKEVWEFLLNPKNTPKWIESCEKEETNTWPPGVGTVYTHAKKDKSVFKFKIIEFVPNQNFLMVDGKYYCRYSFKDLGDKTELDYYEWQEDGELENPLTQDILEKLKSVMET